MSAAVYVKYCELYGLTGGPWHVIGKLVWRGELAYGIHQGSPLIYRSGGHWASTGYTD